MEQVRLIRRRQNERKRSERARRERLMIGYIGVKHPMIYKEAHEYYNILNNVYPNKHDLTKTPPFFELRPGPVVDKMSLQIPLETKKPEQQPATNIIPNSLEVNIPEQQPTIHSIPNSHEANRHEANSLEVNIPEQQPTIHSIPNSHEANSHEANSLEVNIPEQQPTIHSIPNSHEANSHEANSHEANILPRDLQDICQNNLLSEIPQAQIQEIINDLRADPELRRIMDETEALMCEESEERMSQVDIDFDIDINIDISDLLENELQ